MESKKGKIRLNWGEDLWTADLYPRQNFFLSGYRRREMQKKPEKGFKGSQRELGADEKVFGQRMDVTRRKTG